MRLSEIYDEEDDLYDYLHGACWTFAVALSNKTGWKLGWVKDKQSLPLHGYVIDPFGKFVDASGYITPQQIKNKYKISKKNVY